MSMNWIGRLIKSFQEIPLSELWGEGEADHDPTTNGNCTHFPIPQVTKVSNWLCCCNSFYVDCSSQQNPGCNPLNYSANLETCQTDPTREWLCLMNECYWIKLSSNYKVKANFICLFVITILNHIHIHRWCTMVYVFLERYFYFLFIDWKFAVRNSVAKRKTRAVMPVRRR